MITQRMNAEDLMKLEELSALGVPPQLIARELDQSLGAINWRLPHVRRSTNPNSPENRQLRVGRIRSNIADYPSTPLCHLVERAS